jgi:Short C-terminal domain/Phospholipase_D-nuclease N-terminal
MSGFPLLDVFWTIVLFFCWVLWIFLVIWILIDIFRSRDIGGWAKAGWTLFVIFIPLIGVLAYEIVHSDHVIGWHDRYVSDVQAKDEAYRASGGPSDAFELSKLADLHARGVITDAEFEQGKEKILR